MSALVTTAGYVGDVAADGTLTVIFNTHTAAGAPITLGGTPSVVAYRDDGTDTNAQGGTSLSVDYILTGEHAISVNVAELTFDDEVPAAGHDIHLRIEQGTVGGQNVSGMCVGSFSVMNRSHAAITVTPTQVVSTNPRYSTRDLAPIAAGSEPTEIITVTDANGDPVNLSGKTVRLVVASITDDADTEQVVDDTLAASFQYETGGDGITIGGGSSNQVTIEHSADKTGTAGTYRYFLWNVDDKLVLAKGTLTIEPATFGV